MLHGTVYKSWIRLQKSSEKANDELQGNFILLVIWFKIQSFTSCTYNYALCNLIPALRLGSYPAPHNKEKSPRTPDPLSHVQWGSGQRKNLVTLKVETGNENWILMACDIDGMWHWWHVTLTACASFSFSRSHQQLTLETRNKTQQVARSSKNSAETQEVNKS